MPSCSNSAASLTLLCTRLARSARLMMPLPMRSLQACEIQRTSEANPEHGADGFAMVYRRLFGEHDKIIARGNELMEAADLLAGEIAKHPPRTIVGVGVHARALAWFIADAWDGPIEDVDWDKARAQRFVETVCALAGASPLPDLLAA